jgi:hypothetical protein
VHYVVDCPATVAPTAAAGPAGGLLKGSEVKEFSVTSPAAAGRLHVEAILYYRKVDQYLLNFLLGEDSGVTAPVIEMNRVETEVPVAGAEIRAALSAPPPPPEVAPGG